jgi:hypothetical protein
MVSGDKLRGFTVVKLTPAVKVSPPSKCPLLALSSLGLRSLRVPLVYCSDMLCDALKGRSMGCYLRSG